jgi:peptide/nickel transport system substrate-binding protein
VAAAEPRASCAILLLFLLLSGACTKADEPRVEKKGGDGVLRLSLPGEPRTLNPNIGPLDEYALIVGQNIFSKLVSRADDGTILPEVAERWTHSPDGLSYTFHIRPGITFHDGRPLTIADVRATFARIGESVNSELAQHIAGTEAEGDRAVVVRLKTPWAAFLPSLAWFGASILPAHIYGEAWKDNPANMKPIGSGPFRLKSWERGSRIVLEKNPRFFGQGPYVDELDYKIVGSSAAGVQLLIDGHVDFVIGRPPGGMIPRLSRMPGIRVSISPTDGRSYLAFNLRRAPFDDVRLRRAVNLALDRRAIVNTAVSGYGTPAVGFYTPAVPWAYNGNARVPPQDVAAARKLVSEAAPVEPIVFAFAGPPDAEPTPIVSVISKQLAAVGLRCTPTPLPAASYLPTLMKGDAFDMVVVAGNQGPDPDTMVARFGSTGTMQIMGYSNPALDELLARGGMTADPVSRAASYFRAQEILAEDLPIAPLYETIRVAAFRDGLRGVPHEDARGLVADYTFNLVRLPPPPGGAR